MLTLSHYNGLIMAHGTSHIKIDGWYTGYLTYHDILN